MADAEDSKSSEGNLVWVQLPPPAPPHSFVIPACLCLNVGTNCAIVSFYELL